MLLLQPLASPPLLLQPGGQQVLHLQRAEACLGAHALDGGVKALLVE